MIGDLGDHDESTLNLDPREMILGIFELAWETATSVRDIKEFFMGAFDQINTDLDRITAALATLSQEEASETILTAGQVPVAASDLGSVGAAIASAAAAAEKLATGAASGPQPAPTPAPAATPAPDPTATGTTTVTSGTTTATTTPAAAPADTPPATPPA